MHGKGGSLPAFRFSRFILVLVTLATTGCADETLPVPSPNQKIIYYGWSSRDTAYVRTYWRKMERFPFDGIGITVAINRAKRTTGDGATGNLLGWQIFGPKAFALTNFHKAIADLQVPAWQRFTDNFLPAAIATADQDHGLTWFDDARWATIENNWRVLVTIAQAGRCRGILLDPEHYDYACELFSYVNHRDQRVNKPFADYVAIARQRGRQLGAAAREIFPDITIALLYGYTLPGADVIRGNALETTRYALLPAFLDGLLEATAPESRFVDLWEFGDHDKTARQFLDGYDAIKNRAPALAADPDLYRAKMQAGLSLQVDYVPKGTRWHTSLVNQNYYSPAQFQSALHATLAISEQYVWIYSEDHARLFPQVAFPQAYLQAITAARQ